MPDGTHPPLVNDIRDNAYSRHGDAYRWLRPQYDVIAREVAVYRPPWRVIAERATAEGVLGGTGGPLSARSVRLTWKILVRDVEAERAQEAERRLGAGTPAPARPRAPLNWCPPAFAQRDAPPPSGGEHQGSQTAALPTAPLPQQQPAPPPSPEAPKDTSRPVPGSIEAVREMMNLRSGRKANGDPLF